MMMSWSRRDQELLITQHSSLLSFLLHVLDGLLNTHAAAVWARDCTANHQQIVLSIHARYSQASGRNLSVTHVARGAHTLDHARRICRSADRAGSTHVHRTMTLRATTKMVAFDRSGKTSSL